jgi:hypothetical protein
MICADAATKQMLSAEHSQQQRGWLAYAWWSVAPNNSSATQQA